METVTKFLRELFQPPYTYLLCFALAIFVLGAILRFACGAVKSIPRSAAACFAILFIYVISICAMGAEGPSKVLLSCLPFLGEVSDATSIFVMMRTSFSAFLLEAAQMFLLAFIINMLQDLFNRFLKSGGGSWFAHFFIWYFWQCVIVAVGLAANYGVDYLMRRYLSHSFAKWAPVVLLILLATVMVFMALKIIFKTVAFFTNPVFTCLWDFLFHNTVGRNSPMPFSPPLPYPSSLSWPTGWMAAAFSLRWNHTHFFCAGNTPTVDHLVSSVGLAVLDIKPSGSSNLGPPHGGLSYWMKKRPRKAMSGCHTGGAVLSPSLCKRIFCLIQHSTWLIEGDILHSQIAKYRIDRLSVVSEDHRSVMGIILLN